MKLTVEKTASFFRVVEEFEGVVYLSWLGSSQVVVSFRSVDDRDNAKRVLDADGIGCAANDAQDSTLFIRCDGGPASIHVFVMDPNAI